MGTSSKTPKSGNLVQQDGLFYQTGFGNTFESECGALMSHLKHTSGGMGVSISTVLYFELDSTHVVVAFAIGLGMTLIAALYPSIKFSRLPPVEAMRR